MKTVIALTFCVLASCAGLQSHVPSELVGHWRYADRIQSCVYVFNADGTFSGEVVYHAKVISRFTGHWSVDRDNILYDYTRDELGRIPAGTIDRDRLLTVAKDSFVIQAGDGQSRKYQRIP